MLMKHVEEVKLRLSTGERTCSLSTEGVQTRSGRRSKGDVDAPDRFSRFFRASSSVLASIYVCTRSANTRDAVISTAPSMSALFGPLGGTSAPGRAIANAVEALDAALRPWKRAGMHAWEKGLVRRLSDEVRASFTESVSCLILLQDVGLAQVPMTTLEGSELDEVRGAPP
jgi:hypothetical protein